MVSSLEALIAGNSETKQVEKIEQIEMKKIDWKSNL